MIFILLVYSLIQSKFGDASPILTIQRRADTCNDLNNCRTIWSITWGCLLTTLLWTWVTIRPNVAFPGDNRGKSRFEKLVWHPLRGVMKNKLPLFLCALIVPEYILSWAIRQHFKARHIERKVPGWTRAHGFFVIMGGFHLYSLPDGATSVAYPSGSSMPPSLVLALPDHPCDEEIALHPLEFSHFPPHVLEYLAPTEAEIKDKGQADIMAKFLLLLQTLWFVTQCIARGVEQLPLTELEVVTLAYVLMNVLIYLYWWDKPMNVKCPVRVYYDSRADGVSRGEKREWARGVAGIFNKIVSYLFGVQDEFFRLSEESQVPMFWSGVLGGSDWPVEMVALLGTSSFGMTSGAVHILAWNSEFPSHTELLIWRISCIAMTAVPLIATIVCGVVVMSMRRRRILATVIIFPVLLLFPLIVVLYFFARISTLVIAFTTLRALPSDSFTLVSWTTFIPHFN